MSSGLEGATEWRLRTAEGVELAVAELGDRQRPTVVLLHGYPDSKEVWSEVASRLADRFHVVLYDVRGCGRSTAPKPLRGGFTLAKLTEDFRAVVDAVSPDEPVHLVGHDWGSVQGWEFTTVQCTEGRIASFTSVSGPCLDHFGQWIKKRMARPTPRRAAQLIGQGAKSWYIYALHTPVIPELVWQGPLGRRWWPKLLARVERLSTDDYPTSSLPTDAAHGAWLYRDNVRARLRRPRGDAYAHAPVQLITPTKDSFLSPYLYEDLELWVPHLVRRTLPAKHWVPRTRPDQLADWVEEFVTARESCGQNVREAIPASPFGEHFGGQLVLVTGAASGIGADTALAFASAGARIVAVDQDAEGAARTADRARELGARTARAEVVDVADEQAMEKLAARVKAEHGVVDVLVNNAGVAVAGPLLATTTAQWRKLLDVNLWGVIHGCRLFGQQMVERGQGGHIVNVASAAAYLPSRGLGAYSTSKAAVLMLSESLRGELATQGIGVTAVCPGLVNTNITQTSVFAGLSEEQTRQRQRRASEFYARRNYPPRKVATAILRAVTRNDAVVAVTPEARVGKLLARLSPRAVRAIARIKPPF